MNDDLPDETPVPEGIAPDGETQRLLWLLKARHPTVKGEWATFTELRSCVGFGDPRYIDFLAMHTFQGGRGDGRGLKAVAYEIKISRADFAREIKRPEKRAFAESIADECFFATPAGLLRVDEVPEGWGLVEANKAGLRVIKHPLQRQPGLWPRAFVAMIARRVADPPMPAAPPKLWRFAGRDLSLDDVLALVNEHVPMAAEKRARETVERQQKQWERIAAREEQSIRLALSRPMGVEPENVTAYEVDRWLKKMPSAAGLTGDQLRDFKWAVATLERVLGEVQAPPAPPKVPT
jgi:hypothetical protein